MKIHSLNNSPPAPLFNRQLAEGVTHMRRHVVNPENEFYYKLKEPQSGASMVEKTILKIPAPLFEKLRL